jgi:hypothetical protein
MKSVKWHIAVRRIVTALSHKRLQSFVVRSPPQHVSLSSHMPQHNDPAALAPLVPPSPHALPAHPFPHRPFPRAFPARLSPRALFRPAFPRAVSRTLLPHAVSRAPFSRTPSARPLPAASPGPSPRTTSPRPSAATAPPRPRRPLRPSYHRQPVPASPWPGFVVLLSFRRLPWPVIPARPPWPSSVDKAWMSQPCRSSCMNGTFTPYDLVGAMPE